MKKYIPAILAFLLSLFVAFTPYIPYLKGFWQNMGDLAVVAEKLTTCISILFALLSAAFLMQITIFQNSFETIRSSVIKHLENDATIERVSSESFYADFMAKSKIAQNSVWISYLAPFPPDTPNRKERNKYYRDMLELIKSKGKTQINFRRLVRWSESNREWIREMIEELGKTPGFELAILHDINEESAMPLALSVQIIDGKNTWIVAAGDHEQKDDYRDIHIVSKEFGEYFKQYYNRLWNMSDVAKNASQGITSTGKSILDGTYRAKK